MTSETTSIITLENLTKTYRKNFWSKKQTALKNLSVSFEPGTTTCLLGHNGAGKTTTIRTLLGLIHPDQGRVLFEGKPLGRKHRSHIGYMPENNKLPLNLSSLEILNSHLRLMPGTSQNASKIETTLKKVGLWQNRKKPVRSMSKGMGRRLAWAMAVIHEPRFMILDEPFSGLDPLGRKQLSQWIEESHQKGRTLLIATHELEAVRHFCDQYIVLKNGEIIAQNSLLEEEGSYVLELSGTSQEDLQQISQDSSLPEWSSIVQQGWATRLGFKEYQSVHKWLGVCLERGILITSYRHQSLMEDQTLSKLFDPAI